MTGPAGTVRGPAPATWPRLLVRWLPVLPVPAVMLLPVPPCQDLPAQAALLQAAANGQDPLWTTGSLLGHSTAFYGIGGLLARAVGGLVAARVLAMLAMLLLPLGTSRLARHLDGDEDLAAWGGALLGLGHLAFLGFLPFQVALGATLCLLPPILRRRTWPGTAAWALGASAAIWALHALALPALWMGLGFLAPDRRRRLAALAAVPVPLLCWWATRSGPGALLWPPAPLDLPARVLRLWRFLGPPAGPGPWWLPGLWLAAVLPKHLRSWRQSRPEGRGAVLLFLVFLLGAATLPDFLEQPRIVHPWLRLAPFAGGVIVAALPRTAVRLPHRLATVLVLGVLAGWTWMIGWHESALVRPAAEAIRSLPPHETVLGVTLHRPPAGSWMRTYPGLHLPFLYQAEGIGTTLAPFTHGDSPVRLRPGPAEVADLALRDVRRYVAEGSSMATLAVTDGSDDPTFLAVTGLAGLPPCPVPFPEPWRCVRLRPPQEAPQ